MVRRHEIQVLRKAGHELEEIAQLVGVGKRTVQRVVDEPAVATFDSDEERKTRGVGRPSKAEDTRAATFAVSG